MWHYSIVNRARRPHRAPSRVVCASLAALGLVCAPLTTAPASAAAEAIVITGDDMTVSPAHVWADPAVGGPGGPATFGVDIRFPVEPTLAWVATVSLPKLSDGVTSCPVAPDATGLRILCTITGTTTPGDVVMVVEFKSAKPDPDAPRVVSVGGSLAIPLTVCPSTGCSALYDLALTPSEAVVCAGSDLAEAALARYEFGLPWNAVSAVLGAVPGLPAGSLALTGAAPVDGAVVPLAGTVAVPGSYRVPISVTDEFGGVHESALTLDVVDARSARCLELAETGGHAEQLVGAALAALVLGLLLLQGGRAARRPRALSSGRSR